MPMACKEFVYRIGEGDREKRKKERNLKFIWLGIRVKLGALGICKLLMLIAPTILDYYYLCI
jgi:hypothetical protein